MDGSQSLPRLPAAVTMLQIESHSSPDLRICSLSRTVQILWL